MEAGVALFKSRNISLSYVQAFLWFIRYNVTTHSISFEDKLFAGFSIGIES